MAQRRTGGRGRAVLFLVLSLGAAGAFTFMVFQLIQGYQTALEEAEREQVTRQVVVAAVPLYQGQTLTEEHLKRVEVPPTFVPDTTFEFAEDVVGRVPSERILEGEFLREERLANPNAGIGLNAIIPRGERAVSINITDGSAVSGFLTPGNYVDVLVTLQSDTRSREEKTVTLIQACKVLAVDDRMGGNTPDAQYDSSVRPSVTLAVTPEDAEKLAHSHIKGDVTLTLRNDIDVTQVDTHGATANKLIGATAIPVSEVKPAPKTTTKPKKEETNLKIIRGSEVEKKTFR